MPEILVIDSDPATAAALEVSAVGQVTGWLNNSAEDLDRALGQVRDEQPPDLVIADLHGTAVESSELVRACRERQVAIILTAAFGSVEDAVAAMRAGAADFVSKPFSTEQLVVAVDRALDQSSLRRENRDLRAALDDRLRLDNFVSTDPRMQNTLKTVRSVAKARTTVLITGESGTGKTLLARAIHSASDRSSGPFVEVNCGAMPESLLESELFGHVKGAFTGAVKDRDGKFTAADGGTIFLDEIGTASSGLQVKLLRVLQERQFERVGESKQLTADVRVILATNLDLEQAVRDGKFREDLYYRIHVIPLHVPPLRERTSDIVALTDHFLSRFAKEHGKPPMKIDSAALDQLVRAPWPGNVRQLENVLERAVVLCENSWITTADLPTTLGRDPTPTATTSPQSLAAGTPQRTRPIEEPPEVASVGHFLPLKEALEGPERHIIERALAHHGGNRKHTAETLDINRSTLFNKMRKFGLL